MTAREGVRYQLDAGCAVHSPSPALVARARAEECPCVTVSGGRAYPRPGCDRCRGKRVELLGKQKNVGQEDETHLLEQSKAESG